MKKQVTEVLYRLVKENAISETEFEMLVNAILGVGNPNAETSNVSVAYHYGN